MTLNLLIAASKPWLWEMSAGVQERTGARCHLVTTPDQLTERLIKEISPRYIFFPHWSWRIPEEIYANYESVVFHMTDVPFGRGGTPLQNLISRGIYKTVISALRCEKEIDAGAIYAKEPFSLYGNAEEIYIRSGKVIEGMIVDIVTRPRIPENQKGDVTYFHRRSICDGDISVCKNLEQVFDFIRMLDAEGYPRAFLGSGRFKLEFERASLRYDRVEANVVIRMVGQDEND